MSCPGDLTSTDRHLQQECPSCGPLTMNKKKKSEKGATRTLTLKMYV